MSRPCRHLVIAALLAASAQSRALHINFSVDANGISAAGLAGFQTAANIWESQLHDNVTVNITIGVYNFGAGNETIIGQAGSNFTSKSYAQFRNAMAADSQSATDASVLATLGSGSSYSRLINQTNDTPGPDYFATWTSSLDYLYINRANAKALGLLSSNATGEDAAISFNSAYTFDYDRSNGIAAGQIDFIGVALHEIGHALGFVSIVDYIDTTSGNAADFANMPMDFLRYSSDSAQLGISDVSAGTADKYLKIGNLQLAMSTGVNLGDGRQASHFKDNLGLGLMDPTASKGELINITANDLLVMDAIGWNLTAVPEPSTYGVALGGATLLVAVFRRRKAR